MLELWLYILESHCLVYNCKANTSTSTTSQEEYIDSLKQIKETEQKAQTEIEIS